MVKRLLFLPILILSMFLFVNYSQANVLVDDADSASLAIIVAAFTSADVPTGSGMVGDYQIIACGVFQVNTFSDPAPGTWEELDMGGCDGVNGLCTHGIWGRFTDNPASEDITCSWTSPSSVFAAGSFRYNEVDPIDPIIAVACDFGAGQGANVIATAPSVNTVAGSQVARIYTYRNFNLTPTGDSNMNDDTTGSFISNAFANTATNVNMQGETELVLVDGPTGTASIDAGEVAEWRACTIALRMVPPPEPRNVPTMSEWGLIGFAAFAGIAGIWYLRRRQATA